MAHMLGRRQTIHPGFRPGEWYHAFNASVSLNTPAAGVLYLYEYTLPEPVPIQALGWKVTTAGGAGAQVKGGIWAGGPNQRPIGLPPIALNTPVAVTGTGGFSAAVTPATLVGSLWWGTAVDIGAGAPTMQGVATADAWNGNRIGGATLGAISGAATLNQTGNHLTTPFTFTDNIAALDLTSAVFTLGAQALCPIMFFQRAA